MAPLSQVLNRPVCSPDLSPAENVRHIGRIKYNKETLSSWDPTSSKIGKQSILKIIPTSLIICQIFAECLWKKRWCNGAVNTTFSGLFWNISLASSYKWAYNLCFFKFSTSTFAVFVLLSPSVWDLMIVTPRLPVCAELKHGDSGTDDVRPWKATLHSHKQSSLTLSGWLNWTELVLHLCTCSPFLPCNLTRLSKILNFQISSRH